MKANAIDHARVRFAVVHNDIVTRHQRLNGRLAALVAEVEQERILLLHEVGQLLFQRFVLGRLSHIMRAPIG